MTTFEDGPAKGQALMLKRARDTAKWRAWCKANDPRK